MEQQQEQKMEIETSNTEQQQHRSLVPRSSAQHYAACDESKCVSRGKTELFDGSFTCYGDDDGANFPRMCADGYRPHVIPNELSVLAKPRTYHGFWQVALDEDEIDYSEWIPVRYFTCCPPDEQQKEEELPTTGSLVWYTNPYENMTRHCSDPIAILDKEDATESSEDGENNSSSSLYCENPQQPGSKEMQTAVKKVPSIYLDRTASSGNIVNSYLCCDSEAVEDKVFYNSTNSTAMVRNDEVANHNVTTRDSLWQGASLDFLESTECVPYCNQYYDECRARSPYRLRMFNPIVCGYSENGFEVPRPMDNVDGTMKDVVASGLYQCCRSGIPLDPYIQDSTFWKETSTFFAVYLVAGVFSLVVILGLTIPLVGQLRNGTHQIFQERPVTVIGTGRMASNDSVVSSVGRGSTRSIRKPYSAYNLYLIFLAIPDLLLALYALVKIGSMMAQEIYPFWSPYAIMNSMAAFHVLCNLWLNAIVMHQVLVLLKSSRNVRRIEQPSLTRVTVQALTVYVIAAAAGVFAYFAYNIPISNGLGKVETIILNQGYTGWFFIFVFLPIGYSVYVSIAVCRNGYLPPSTGSGSRSERARRELAIYFFRIVAVFGGVWFPSVVFRFVGNYYGLPWLQIVTICGPAVQAIATSALVLTKSDAKKYIVDLVTLRVVRQCMKLGKVSEMAGNDSYGKNAISKMSNSQEYRGTLNETDPTTANDSTNRMNSSAISAKMLQGDRTDGTEEVNMNDIEAFANGDAGEDKSNRSGHTVSTRRGSPTQHNHIRSSNDIWTSQCQDQSTTGASALLDISSGD